MHGSNETGFIKKFPEKFFPEFLIIILPPYSLLNTASNNKNQFSFPQISALDPFAKNLRYGFVLRNTLAFHLSKEMAVLYLSHKSSLSGLIETFRNNRKSVKIFDGEENGGKKIGLNDENAEIKIEYSAKDNDKYGASRHNDIRQFILNSLEKGNIAIDNLLKLSNIKLNVNEKEIIRALSILEMNSEVERRPGGIIKKI